MAVSLKVQQQLIKYAEDRGLVVTTTSSETKIAITKNEHLAIDRDNTMWHVFPNPRVPGANNSNAVKTLKAAYKIIDNGGVKTWTRKK